MAAVPLKGNAARFHVPADPPILWTRAPQRQAARWADFREYLCYKVTTTTQNFGKVTHLAGVLRQRLRGVPLALGELNFSLQLLSQLRDKGWHKSIREKHPLDGGQPIPWYTYPAAEWLASRVRPTDSIFEFGAGHSSVWYGRHAERVISVDDSAAWLEKVRPLVRLRSLPIAVSPRSCDVCRILHLDSSFAKKQHKASSAGSRHHN